MNNGKLKMNYTVSIRTDYVVKDQKKTQEILERVSTIISNSYKRNRKGDTYAPW